MFTSVIFPLFAITSMVQALPLDSLDSPVLAVRKTGEVVTGSLHAGSGGGTTGGSTAPVVPVAPVAPVQAWDPQTGAPLPSKVAAPSNTGGDDVGVTGGTGGGGSSSYKMYSGDGKSWPSQNEWIGDFETMFNNNKPVMKISCTQWNQPNPTDKEISDMHSGIVAAAKASGVDQRFILAIIMQESKGCVRVPTTNSGQVRNPGLMQDHDGKHDCTSTPCSTAVIHGMISEGTTGTDAGDGLAACINQAANQGAVGAQAFYWAARIYNTGSYAKGSDLGQVQWGTPCYSSDIANRLTGWASADSPCTLKPPHR